MFALKSTVRKLQQEVAHWKKRYEEENHEAEHYVSVLGTVRMQLQDSNRVIENLNVKLQRATLAQDKMRNDMDNARTAHKALLAKHKPNWQPIKTPYGWGIENQNAMGTYMFPHVDTMDGAIALAKALNNGHKPIAV